MQVLTRGIHALLSALSAVTGNYGWAILLLTLAIRLVLLPLGLWNRRIGKRSAALQAEVKQVKEQVPPAEAERRLQELQARMAGPMAVGCLAMLAQWPVLFAMYSALSQFPLAVPAGFLWLESLALPDPTFILPVLVICTQLWQSLATMPREQRAMAFVLPVILGFMLLKASAAVSLYWLASNLFSLAEHYWLARRPNMA